MAEKLCELKKKGGGGGRYTETNLWTNSAPTSSFAEQTVTLSQSVDNFKYIAVKYKAHTSSEDSTKFIISTDDLKKGINTTTNHNICFVGSQTSGASYSRIIFYISSTSLSINTAYRTNRAENNNAYAIPLEILGLNELAQGTKQASSGTIPAVAGQTTKITLGWQPQFVCLTYLSSSNRITVTYEASRSTTKVNRWVKSGSSVTETDQTLPNTSTNSRTITSIDSDGFTVGPNDDSTSICNYYAYGVS